MSWNARHPRAGRATATASPEGPSRGRSGSRLARDEEQRLAVAARQGDNAARARLIEANLPLVLSIARRYEGHGLPFEDLVGEGCVGLIEAVGRYDPNQGTRFGTYATFWVRKEIRLALRSKVPMVRLPEHLFGMMGRWRKHEQMLRRAEGAAPTNERIAQAMGISREQSERLERALASRTPLRVEGPTPATNIDPIDHRGQRPHEVLEEAEEREALREAIAELPRRERTLVTHRFGLKTGVALTLKEIGRRMGLNRHAASDMERTALRRLGSRVLRIDEPEEAVGSLKRAPRSRTRGTSRAGRSRATR